MWSPYQGNEQKVTLVELCILNLAWHLVFFQPPAGPGAHSKLACSH